MGGTHGTRGPSKCTRHNYACRIAPKSVAGNVNNSAQHRADQPTKRSQSPDNPSLPRQARGRRHRRLGRRRQTTPMDRPGCLRRRRTVEAATASPPPSATFTSTGPSASVNSSNCTPASSTPGAAVCTSLSPSTPAIPPGPKQFKPRNANHFRRRRGHRHPRRGTPVDTGHHA